MENLDSIIETLRTELEAKNRARDLALEHSRALVRLCGNAIRAMHRQDRPLALQGLAEARALLAKMAESVRLHPDLGYTGYYQDAAKEVAEAAITFALLEDAPLPTCIELGVEPAAYLNGLCEAASELRRYTLDILRRSHVQQAERLLGKMDTIYDVLMTLDFPDAVSGGLRGRVDALRGVLERTRGDVTMSIRQQRLQDALEQAYPNPLQGENLEHPLSD